MSYKFNPFTGNFDLAPASGSFIPLSEKGAPLGVATLDGGGKVPVSQLPNSVMEFKGVFDPATATFTDASGNAGDVWQATAAGSYDAGSGSITYAIGDWSVHNGSIFQKSLNSNSVASVNGFTGIVVLDSDNISEGTSNLYFTDVRARTAVVDDSITDGIIDKAPSQNAVFDALALKANTTLSNLIGPTDINQDLIFDNTSDRLLTIENTSAIFGKRLTIQSGGATGTNLSGGDLYLSSGLSTGNGTSTIRFLMPAAGASGATPNTPAQSFVMTYGSSTTEFRQNPPSGSSASTVIYQHNGSGFLIKPNIINSASSSITATFSSGDQSGSGGTGTVGLSSGASFGVGTSGVVNIRSGQSTSGGASGNISIGTGNASTTSGSVIISTGTGSTRGKILLQDGSEGTVGHVWTQTATNGTGAWQAVGTSYTPKVEFRTISAGEATAKSLTLTNTPSFPSEVILHTVGGSIQFYGDDYTVSGTTLTWNGLGLDGVLASGDKIVIQYNY